MVKKSKDAEEFEQMRKIGMSFSSPDTEFQPDSSSVQSGVIGVQEYGIVGGVALENLTVSEILATDYTADTDVESQLSPLMRDGELAGASEWTATHALDPEQVVEEAEKFASEDSEQKRPKRNLKLIKK